MVGNRMQTKLSEKNLILALNVISARFRKSKIRYVIIGSMALYLYGIDFRLPIWMLDMHSVCMAYMLERGIEIPKKPGTGLFLSGDSILEFAGLGTEPKPHNAMNGARYEFEALYRRIYGKSVLPQFSDCPVPAELAR